jgi:Ner family transcriptional regulator
MSAIIYPMKPTYTPKKQPSKAEDWHPADVVCALRKAGWSLRRLSKHHNYAQATQLANALRQGWPRGERLIADAIGVEPWEIWPSRYADTTGRRAHDRRFKRPVITD